MSKFRSFRELKPWLYVWPGHVYCAVCFWIHKPRTRKGTRKAVVQHDRCGHFGWHLGENE